MAETKLATIDPDEFLEHYGVKGMRWGKRNNSKSKSASDSIDELADNEDAINAKSNLHVARTQGTTKLSNKELQEVVTRMNLEQQYAKLNPTVVQKGYSNVQKTMGVVGTVTSIVAVANSPLGKLIKKQFA